jgi:hypothetical protein
MERAARAMARMNSREEERSARSIQHLRPEARAARAVMPDPPLLQTADCRLPDAALKLRHKAASLPVPFVPEKNNPSSPPQALCCIRPIKDLAKERVVS